MNRNALLIATVLLCFAGFATATEHKKQSAPQSQNPAQQNEMYAQSTEVHINSDASAKGECRPKADTHSKTNLLRDDPEGDSQASQNQVEYGGAG